MCAVKTSLSIGEAVGLSGCTTGSEVGVGEGEVDGIDPANCWVIGSEDDVIPGPVGAAVVGAAIGELDTTVGWNESRMALLSSVFESALLLLGSITGSVFSGLLLSWGGPKYAALPSKPGILSIASAKISWQE